MENRAYSYQSPLKKDILSNILSEQEVGFFTGGFSGKINEDKIQIVYCSEIRNSWTPIFTGKLLENQEGTLITGAFRASKGVRIFMLFMRCFFIFIFLIELASVLFSSEMAFMPTRSFLHLIFMLAFSYAIEYFAILMGKKDQDEIIKFIERQLQAKRL